MMKFILTLALLLPTLVMANVNSYHKDIIGNWQCVAESEDYKSSSIMRYYADGSAKEWIEVRDERGDYSTIEFMVMEYDWQVVGNKLHMSGLTDFVFYESYYKLNPYQTPIKSSDETIQEMKEIIAQNSQENSWHYIEFEGKDKHHYRFEDGYSGTCQRLKD